LKNISGTNVKNNQLFSQQSSRKSKK